MGLIEKMDEESECPETIFKELIENKRKFDVFVFLEGDDDINYYESRLSVFIGNKKMHPFKCKGKSNVLKVHKLLNSDSVNIEKIKLLFFVDHDFDTDISYPEDIYVTPCYSIENFYFSDNALRNIVENFYKIDSVKSTEKDEFNNCINFLTNKRDSYINEMIYANAFYSLQMQKKNITQTIVDLSPIKNFSDVRGISDLKILEEKIKNPFALKNIEIENEIKKLTKNSIMQLRGKYFEQAMLDDFKKLLEYVNNPKMSNGLIRKKRKNVTPLIMSGLWYL